MCVFCAAIPAAASMGVVVSSRQRAADKAASVADETGAASEAARPRRLRAGRVSAGVVVLLLIGSVLYHTHFQA